MVSAHWQINLKLKRSEKINDFSFALSHDKFAQQRKKLEKILGSFNRSGL